MKRAVPLFLVVVGLVMGCQEAPQPTASESADKSEAIEKHKAKEEKHEGCADGHGQAGTDRTMRKAKDAVTGADMVLVGGDLAGLSVVSVKELVENPDDYAGKTIRVQGDVNAMCHHGRGWFSIQDEGDRSGNFVRIVTNPNFLVPAGSIGKKARAEGRVDVIEESAKQAQHYAENHKIGDPKKIEGPVKRIVIRATGAEFI
jgi:hypothetical protein